MLKGNAHIVWHLKKDCVACTEDNGITLTRYLQTKDTKNTSTEKSGIFKKQRKNQTIHTNHMPIIFFYLTQT